MLHRMAVGSVVDMGYGRGFSAGLDLDEEGPFSYVIGPQFVSAEEAIEWARARAPRVRVRVGDRFYSAGPEQVRDLPPWEPADRGRAPRNPGYAQEADRWRVEARIVWLRSDAAAVVRRFAEALLAELAGRVAHEVTEAGWRVAFELGGGSRAEANEAACRVLRAAWAATGIEATPGVDYDMDSMSMSPA
jgi:hypothetical protein